MCFPQFSSDIFLQYFLPPSPPFYNPPIRTPFALSDPNFGSATNPHPGKYIRVG